MMQIIVMVTMTMMINDDVFSNWMMMEMISMKKMMRNKYDFFLKLSSKVIKLKKS